MLCSTRAVFPGPPPAPPSPLEKAPLPILPLVAPVALAVFLALVFESAVAIVMGALGPLMVFGGWWESRRRSATKHDLALLEHQDRLLEHEEHVDRARRDVVNRATRLHPGIRDWAANSLWRGPLPTAQKMSIGRTRWYPPAGHPLAGTGAIAGMPALVDMTAGLALVAAADQQGLWRALALQWRAHASHSVAPSWDLADEPPRDFRGSSRLVWVSTSADAPEECTSMLIHRGGVMAELHTPGELPQDVQLDSLGHAEAMRIPRGRLGVSDRVVFPPDLSRRDQLWAALAHGGPFFDLLAEGPHTIVWGATGSGKSVSVVALVSSLAAHYSPEHVVCVLIDFKGGAGLAPLQALPHTVGWVTDLAPETSTRALRGLRAEMTRRERILEGASRADWSELDPTQHGPRLVVVVDEVAWLLANQPLWAEAITDIAARGRSLGVHLVLSTQRLGGVISRAMMANIAFRVCGRVADEAELREGMPEAAPSLVAALRHVRPGQVLVAGAISTPHMCAVEPVGRLARDSPASTWTVWGEALPSLIPWSHHGGEWAWRECLDSHSLVSVPGLPGAVAIVGDRLSGRTTAAYALAVTQRGSLLAPPDGASLWTCLDQLSGTDRALVVDDLDVLLHSCGSEGEASLVNALEGFSGALVMTMSGRHRLSRSLSRLASQVLVLPMAKPEDRDLWGASARASAGAGLWRGDEIQIAHGAPAPQRWSPTEPELPADPIVVTNSPEQWAGVSVSAVIDSADQPGAWAALAKYRVSQPILIDGLSHRDLRSLVQTGAFIPPLPPPEGSLWLWEGSKPVLTSRERWRA